MNAEAEIDYYEKRSEGLPNFSYMFLPIDRTLVGPALRGRPADRETDRAIANRIREEDRPGRALPKPGSTPERHDAEWAERRCILFITRSCSA